MKRKSKTAVPIWDTGTLRQRLSTCTAKVCAYNDKGMLSEAQEWAVKLMRELHKEGLIK